MPDDAVAFGGEVMHQVERRATPYRPQGYNDPFQRILFPPLSSKYTYSTLSVLSNNWHISQQAVDGPTDSRREASQTNQNINPFTLIP